jgi:hypothetical protein
VALFGNPKQLKHLDQQLTVTRMSLSMFARLPASNQEHFLRTAPQNVSQAVADAVRAGHGMAAKAMLDKALNQTPPGATEEQWRTVLAGGVAALPSP